MYKTALVDAYIKGGRRVLDELEKSGLKIKAAFWSHGDDEDDWKLVVVSPEVAEKGSTHVYKEHRALLYNMDVEQPGLPFWWDRVQIISPSSLIYQSLRQRTVSKDRPVREGPALDAYIYKME
jgi:hypothetical protein